MPKTAPEPRRLEAKDFCNPGRSTKKPWLMLPDGSCDRLLRRHLALPPDQEANASVQPAIHVWYYLSSTISQHKSGGEDAGVRSTGRTEKRKPLSVVLPQTWPAGGGMG